MPGTLLPPLVDVLWDMAAGPTIPHLPPILGSVPFVDHQSTILNSPHSHSEKSPSPSATRSSPFPCRLNFTSALRTCVFTVSSATPSRAAI